MTVLKIIQHDQAELNRALLAGFHEHAEDADVRRSHLFEGRYENIYLTSTQVPELTQLIDTGLRHARELLGRDDLRYGLWFNYMPPGAITTRHNHDNEDELLSAVYYVAVPDDSGDLLIYDKDPPTRITPVEGQMIFFPPTIDHEVTINNSDAARLSIAINFGPAAQD